MINCNYLINIVQSYYSNKIADNEFIAQLDEAELEKNEEYSALKYLLRELKIDRQRAVFNENKPLIGELTAKIEEAEKQIEKFRSASIVKNATYDCEICHDTGYDGEKRCKCFFERLNEEAYRFLEVRNIALHSFKDDTLSTKSHHETEYKTVKRYADKFPDTDKNLVISGEKGTGKTFLAECLVNEINAKKYNSLMISSFDLNNVFIKNFKNSLQEKLITNEILTSCDLLVIDDLGAEPILNKVTVENLTAIISQRSINRKPFVITTNLSSDEFSDRYGERLFSRIYGKQTGELKVNGIDLRLNRL